MQIRPPDGGCGLKRVCDLFVSGGKDSVVAAVIGFREAVEKGAEARVVYIDEFRAFKVPEELVRDDPVDYVRAFAEWLGADLVVIAPEFDYWEGVKMWGYPAIFNKRWCYEFLKKRPLREFLASELRQGLRPVWVTGVRRRESERRERLYHSPKYVHRYEGVGTVEYYHPILDWSDKMVDDFIRENGIPENRLWRLGFSCECLCMAGMSLRRLDKLIAERPDLVAWLAAMDLEVQSNRRRGPAYVAPLMAKRVTLSQYVMDRMRQRRMDDYGVGSLG
jgi:3'-phosphoadenosine 5'-phosphosulfate sulfotransferase (PAPS reductase)/FAD synthetase